MSVLAAPSDLVGIGFLGFATCADLQASRCGGVTAAPGIYAVINHLPTAPRFLAVSQGGWFKGKDPTVAESLLVAKWVPGSALLYIGKATSLRTRVKALVDYGVGKAVGHQGGRYLWQVEGCDGFVVAWKEAPDPRAAEIKLLTAFEEAYGRLPFANVSH